MLDGADLETNVFEFVHKSFQFDLFQTVADVEYAVFHRTETESESQFRPKLVRLVVVVPRGSLVHDLAADLVLVAPDGVHPGRRGSGSAVEAAAETSEFTEQGVAWVRLRRKEGEWVYLPKDRRADWSAEDLASLP